jgi:hypothetical protein
VPDGRKKDGKLWYPVDTRQWKTFDLNYLECSNDPRNVRFALSTNGMNPFGEMTNPHNTWQVILSLYNIPSWLCHKRKYLMLTILISGPKEAGIDIDVFFETLMEDMQKLWEEGSVSGMHTNRRALPSMPSFLLPSMTIRHA